MERISDLIYNSRKTLFQFSESNSDAWSVDDAMKGVSIMGGTGSGKTTASGKAIAELYLNEGWGGLVLCAKSDESKMWEQYCKEAGRLDDLIVFKKGTKHTHGDHVGEEMVFNPIDYEMKRIGEGAGETQNITNIFMNIYRMGNRIASEGDTKEERYWDTALKRCLNRVIELLKLAGEDLSYANMVKVISSSVNLDKNTLADAIISIDEQKSLPQLGDDNFCLKCLIIAYYENFVNKNEISNEKLNSFNLVEDYFSQVMPSMGSRTKSVVTESFMGLAEPFLSGLLYKHFSGKTNIFPEWTFQKNKIIVLDFPIKEFLEAGIIAQCVFKLLFQQAVERRKVEEFPTPVFLWCDEAQYFVNPYDQIFLTTARSSRTATVFLSQSISNYFAVMGSGSDAKARVDSLMGNLCTKIFHANSDSETNEYASRLIGNSLTQLRNSGQQQGMFSITETYSQGVNSQYLPQVQPREFTTLKTGGYANDFQVQGFLLSNGKEWSDGRNFRKVLFNQNIKS